MLFLGHLGIGAKLVAPWTAGIRRRWVFLGAILPDLIDKPLYYGMVWATGLKGVDLGLISGTRTFGHSAAFVLLIAILAGISQSRILAGIVFGAMSHLLIDNIGDLYFHPGAEQASKLALLFPLMGWRFPITPYDGMADHGAGSLNPWNLGGEILGALVLGWDYWKMKHEPELLEDLKKRRWFFRRMRLKRRGFRSRLVSWDEDSNS